MLQRPFHLTTALATAVMVLSACGETSESQAEATSVDALSPDPVFGDEDALAPAATEAPSNALVNQAAGGEPAGEEAGSDESEPANVTTPGNSQ